MTEANMEVIGPVVNKGTDIVLSPSLEQVREYIRVSKSENTLRGYKADWRAFFLLCEGEGLFPLPALPETVAGYICECARRLKGRSIPPGLKAKAAAPKAVWTE